MSTYATPDDYEREMAERIRHEATMEARAKHVWTPARPGPSEWDKRSAWVKPAAPPPVATPARITLQADALKASARKGRLCPEHDATACPCAVCAECRDTKAALLPWPTSRPPLMLMISLGP